MLFSRFGEQFKRVAQRSNWVANSFYPTPTVLVCMEKFWLSMPICNAKIN